MKTKMIVRYDALACLERAERELKGFNKKDRLSNMMDFDSLGKGPVRMDWTKLYNAPAFDFAHDCYGIQRHMDRSSYPGKLGGLFLPRCAKAKGRA